MIIEEIKNIKSGKKDLRKFGVTIGIALTLLGVLFLWQGKEIYVYFFILSATLIFHSLLIPNLLKPLQKIWMTFAVMMGWFMSRVLLSILFYIIVTPIGLITGIIGKRFLDLKFEKSKESYWNFRQAKEVKRSDYERQF
ncbi:SxtJ family membrane protein [Acidobacteriota bacterium]